MKNRTYIAQVKYAANKKSPNLKVLRRREMNFSCGDVLVFVSYADEIEVGLGLAMSNYSAVQLVDKAWDLLNEED